MAKARLSMLKIKEVLHLTYQCGWLTAVTSAAARWPIIYGEPTERGWVGRCEPPAQISKM